MRSNRPAGTTDSVARARRENGNGCAVQGFHCLPLTLSANQERFRITGEAANGPQGDMTDDTRDPELRVFDQGRRQAFIVSDIGAHKSGEIVERDGFVYADMLVTKMVAQSAILE